MGPTTAKESLVGQVGVAPVNLVGFVLGDLEELAH
jgi:hypothetical protein